MTEPDVVSTEVKAESKVDNKLKTITFFSDLAGRLEAISRESVPGSSTILNMAKAGLAVAFSEFKGVVDTLNTTTDGQTPLQNIVDDKKIKQVTDALQAAMLSIPGSTTPATTPTTTPESQKPKVGILKGFVDSINGIAIADPKTLDLLEKIVNELESSFQTLESSGVIDEIKRKVGPSVGRKLIADGTIPLPTGVRLPLSTLLSSGALVEKGLNALGGYILPILKGQAVTQLGLTPEEAAKINPDSYANLLQSTVGLFLTPLKKKIADERALIAGNLTWEQINEKINSLEGSIAAAKKKIEEQISKIEQQAPEDMTAQIFEMAKQAKELEELVQKRADPDKIKLENAKKYLNGFLPKVEGFMDVMKNPTPGARDSLLDFVDEIEKTFPNEPSLSKVIEKIKGELAEGPAPQPSGWTAWFVGGAMSMVGLGADNIQTSLTELKGSLAKIVPKAVAENEKVIDLNAAAKAKASTIVGEMDKLVELESKKQEKIIFAELEKNYNTQLKILNGLGDKIADLKNGIDSYKKSYFQFFLRFFNTESYRVHNVLEAHEKLAEAVVTATSSVGADAQKILEAQEKLGEALGKLDKTQQVPITGTEHIKGALKKYEELEGSRPKKPSVETSSPNLPKPVAVVTATEAPPEAPIPSEPETPDEPGPTLP